MREMIFVVLMPYTYNNWFRFDVGVGHPIVCLSCSGCDAFFFFLRMIKDKAKQPSQVACFSENLKCWEAWDTTCGHKAKDITPSVAWRREARKEEALDDLPVKGRERAVVNQTNIGTVSKATLGKLLRRGGAHMGFSQRIDTTLNWTELIKEFGSFPLDEAQLGKHDYSHVIPIVITKVFGIDPFVPKLPVLISFENKRPNPSTTPSSFNTSIP